MKKTINFKFLIICNLTIIFFFRNFLFKNPIMDKDVVQMSVLLGIAVVLNVVVILFSKMEFSPTKKFLIAASFIGIGYILIAPILHGIDETAHFSRVYSFFLDSRTTDSGAYQLPKAILNAGSSLPEHGGNFSLVGTRIANDDLVEAENLRGARLYTPLSYLPYLIPVWVLGFLIKTNLFAIVTSARFFGFLLYLIASVYAIKTIPKRKDFMALFCLMPIVISSGCTINADLLTNCSMIVFIAIWYRLYYEKKQITIKDIVLIIITGILAGYAKMVYALEFLLIFFLPKECFGGTNKQKAKVLGIVIGVILAATLINVFLAAGSMDNSYEGFQLQKEFVLTHPLKFLAILAGNILGNYSFFYTFTTNFTILQNVFGPSQFVQLLYFIALLMCIFKEEADLKLGTFTKISIMTIGLVIISMMCVSLYLQWTSEQIGVGVNQIEGMQSRYYIPVMLMFLISLASKKDTLNIDDNVPWFIAIWANITILINIMLLVV